jgi:serine/threonine protein kinase
LLAESSGFLSRSQISFNELIVEKEIGEGSYGKVCLGRWNDAPVALKFCNKKTNLDDFLSEIKIMMYVIIIIVILNLMILIVLLFFVLLFDMKRITSTSKCCSIVWSFIGWSSTCHHHGILFRR